MYLDVVKAFVKEVSFARPNQIVPCTEAELTLLEAELGVQFPAAFREYLLWCGHGLGEFMRGSLWRTDFPLT